MDERVLVLVVGGVLFLATLSANADRWIGAKTKDGDTVQRGDIIGCAAILAIVGMASALYMWWHYG